jgi:hypothetical protein
VVWEGLKPFPRAPLTQGPITVAFGRRPPRVDVAKEHAPIDRRDFVRVSLDAPGKIFVQAAGIEKACRVANLSPAGAEIVGDIDLPSDEPIVLYVEGIGRFEGKVAWRHERNYGLKFNKPAGASAPD